MISTLLAISSAGMLLSIVIGLRAPRWWLAGLLVGASAALSAAVLTLASEGGWEFRSAMRLGGEAIHLQLDALSAFFLALLGVIGGAGGVAGAQDRHERTRLRAGGGGEDWGGVLVPWPGLGSGS